MFGKASESNGNPYPATIVNSKADSRAVFVQLFFRAYEDTNFLRKKTIFDKSLDPFGNALVLTLFIFVDFAYPKKTLFDKNDYSKNNSLGSNLGLRKYGAFNRDKLTFGMEYTRLVQGLYYNLQPTPNWYDDRRFNYHSYQGRRWAAHSGSDSDDLLIYAGYIGSKTDFIYGINYERHGVNYKFPPEVKFESKVALTYKLNNIFLNIVYENEYYEHYGFVDNANNVWSEEFEPGSVQRTKTILLLIEKKIFQK